MATESMKWPNRMNPTDAVFWYMDRIPEFRSTIASLVILKRPPSRERIREDFERLSSSLVRMRQRVVEVPFGLAPPEWVEDAQFDLDYHVREVAVPAPGGLEDLLEELSPLYATPFDPNRPLWEAYMAEGLLGDHGAMFIKMHHCMTDGVGGSRLFESLMGERLCAPRRDAPRIVRRRSTDPASLLWRAMWHNMGEATAAGAAVIQSLLGAVRRPGEALADLGRGLRAASGFASELVPSRAESPLRGKRSLSRRLAIFEMSLSDFDRVRERIGATINDIVLTIVSGAMHRWHTSRGVEVAELRALVPANIRAEHDTSAGNRLALLAMRLPSGEPNPLRRLRLIQQRMGRVKSDRRATLYPWLARFIMTMPFSVAVPLGRQQTARTNFVCTNVPGPRRVCYFAGEPIERIYPYAPMVGDHPVAIALFSYGRVMYVGLDVDPMEMTDLPHFLDALRESYEELINVGRNADVTPQRPTVRRGQRRRGVRAARSRLR